MFHGLNKIIYLKRIIHEQLRKRTMFNFKKKTAKKPNIFIIEDSHVFLQTLKLKLKKMYGGKVQIKGFTETETFFEMMKDGVEIVIMDYHLDEQSSVEGIALLEKIKLTSPGTFVLVLTAEEDLATAKKCFDLGADSYMVKSPESLDKVVTEIHARIALTNFL